MPNKISSVGLESTIQPQLSTTTKLYYITKIYTKPLLTSRFLRRHKIKLELFKQTLSYIIKPNFLENKYPSENMPFERRFFNLMRCMINQRSKLGRESV